MLSAFLGTLNRPLSAFERKAIIKNYPRPDVDCVYTPSLHIYMPSFLSGVKTVGEDNTFIAGSFVRHHGPGSHVN